MVTSSSRNTVRKRRRMTKKTIACGTAAGRDWALPARRRRLHLLSTLGPSRLLLCAGYSVVVHAVVRLDVGVRQACRPVKQHLLVNKGHDARVRHDLPVDLRPERRPGGTGKRVGLGEQVVD